MEKYPGSNEETGSRQLHQPNQPWQLIWGRCWSQILQCKGKAMLTHLVSAAKIHRKGQQGPAALSDCHNGDIGQFCEFLILSCNVQSSTSDLEGCLEPPHLDLTYQSHFSATKPLGRLLCHFIQTLSHLAPLC